MLYEVRQTLEHMLELAKFMKGKDGDYLYFNNGTCYLLQASNYIRWCLDNQTNNEFCNDKVFSVSVVKYILSIEDPVEADTCLQSSYSSGGMLREYACVMGGDGLQDEDAAKIRMKILGVVSWYQLVPISYNEVSNSPDYLTLKEMKAGDGARPFIRDRYVMYFFNGLIPTVKGDSVLLNIYDNHTDPYFLADFIVVKAKNKGMYHNAIMYYKV